MRVLLTLLLACATGIACAQDDFQPLIEASAARLQLADTVARFKYARQLPVEDLARERQVLEAAVTQGRALNLPASEVEALFNQQISASKQVQQALIGVWQNSGAQPEAAPDLQSVVRPQLDQLQQRLLQGLLDSTAARRAANCREHLANQTQAYVRQTQLDRLHAEALGQSLSSVCTF